MASKYAHVAAYASIYGHADDIEARLKRARRDRAPADAVYFSDVRKRWVTLREINPVDRLRVEDNLKRADAKRLEVGRSVGIREAMQS